MNRANRRRLLSQLGPDGYIKMLEQENTRLTAENAQLRRAVWQQGILIEAAKRKGGGVNVIQTHTDNPQDIVSVPFEEFQKGVRDAYTQGLTKGVKSALADFNEGIFPVLKTIETFQNLRGRVEGMAAHELAGNNHPADYWAVLASTLGSIANEHDLAIDNVRHNLRGMTLDETSADGLDLLPHIIAYRDACKAAAHGDTSQLLTLTEHSQTMGVTLSFAERIRQMDGRKMRPQLDYTAYWAKQTDRVLKDNPQWGERKAVEQALADGRLAAESGDYEAMVMLGEIEGGYADPVGGLRQAYRTFKRKQSSAIVPGDSL